MAQQVSDLGTLQAYFNGVLKRAEHHAPGVAEVCLTLLGCLVWKMDNNERLSVLTKDGEMKNVLWVYINGAKYAFSYDHDNFDIVVKKNNTHGPVVASFNNKTKTDEIKNFFKGL